MFTIAHVCNIYLAQSEKMWEQLCRTFKGGYVLIKAGVPQEEAWLKNLMTDAYPGQALPLPTHLPPTGPLSCAVVRVPAELHSEPDSASHCWNGRNSVWQLTHTHTYTAGKAEVVFVN